MADQNELKGICLLAREAYFQVPPTDLREVIVLCMDVNNNGRECRMFVVLKTEPRSGFEEAVKGMNLHEKMRQRILDTALTPSDGLLRVASITKDGDGMQLATLRVSLGDGAVS